MSNVSPPRYLMVSEIADAFGCSERQVWRWIATAALKATKFGGITRVSIAAIDDFVGRANKPGPQRAKKQKRKKPQRSRAKSGAG